MGIFCDGSEFGGGCGGRVVGGVSGCAHYAVQCFTMLLNNMVEAIAEHCRSCFTRHSDEKLSESHSLVWQL